MLAQVDPPKVAVKQEPGPPGAPGEEFREFLERTRAAGLRVIVMRDAPGDLLWLQELDVLAPEEQAEAVSRVAADLGWELQDTGAFFPRKRSFLLYRDRALLKIDLHTQFIDRALIYMDAAGPIARAMQEPDGITCLSHADWWAHVVVHTILGKVRLSGKYKRRLSDRLLTPDELAGVLERARGFGLADVLAAVARDPVATLSDARIVADLRRRARRRLWLRAFNLPRELWFRTMWRAGRMLGLRRGFTIAFIGPDGAGKSTSIGAFADLFAAMQIPVRRAYMGPWEYSILPTDKVLRHFGAGPLDDTVPDEFTGLTRAAKVVKAIVKRYVWYTHALVDMFARYLIRVYGHLLLRRTVLLDRYMYDILIGYHNAPVRNAAALRRFMCAIFPRPDFVILLDNDPRVIWERKKEYSLELIEDSIARYRKLAEARAFDVVNTILPPRELAEAFVRANWRRMIRLRRDRSLWQKLAGPFSRARGEARRAPA